MRKVVVNSLVILFFFSCTGEKTKENLSVTRESEKDSVAYYSDTLFLMMEEEVVPDSAVADELFDDFIFNYASNNLLQRKRTTFPLPYYKGEEPIKVEQKDWKHDSLFIQQGYYTLLFDSEEDMDMVRDTTLRSVQVEWIFLEMQRVKKYYFERKQGVWMLEAINLLNMEQEKDENFFSFYAQFAKDSLYQSDHICDPLPYVTIDPDDEFSIFETTLDLNQWFAFRPMLPADTLSNINYGQKNSKNSNRKILKINGIGNGFSNIFYFRRRGDKWELYRYEDASV